jgi:hypothetical protein
MDGWGASENAVGENRGASDVHCASRVGAPCHVVVSHSVTQSVGRVASPGAWRWLRASFCCLLLVLVLCCVGGGEGEGE